ncbi:MAG TPA: M6 family metalloprotease domain-containing protein [bacterium]|jgi:immune inhibitor A
MKFSAASLCALLLVLSSSSLLAMPPHPDLLARIERREIAAPYYLQHFDELHSAGVDAASPVRTIDLLRRRALDENINILVILVDFSDHVAQVQPVYFDSLIYGNHTGTLDNYYQQVSYGNLSLVTVNMPSALGWQRAPQTYAYYVDNQNGQGSYPQNAQRLTEDCIQLVDSFVDFSQYDNDGDGYVDALFILHSGPGAEFTGHNTDIWSHAWATPTAQHVDGVIAQRYSMEPEYWQRANDMTCGVFAHEMGHAVFGLPDLYDTGYHSAGLGRWSLMAGGSWNGTNGNSPAAPDAWCRIRMGFVSPSVVTGNLINASIPNIETSPVIYRLWPTSAQTNEYFLVENRQQRGYDLRLPGNGLLIYHIDETANGNDNPWYPGHTGSGHYEVALQQADGLFELDRNQGQGDSGDPYPSWDSASFTSSTLPSSRRYTGDLTRVAIRNISASADTMTADLAIHSGPGNVLVAQLPDAQTPAGDTASVPVVLDSTTGWSITSVELTVACDSSMSAPVAPYFDRTGALIPADWTVTETHSAGLLSLVASGATPIVGPGPLLSLTFRVDSDVAEGTAGALQFTRLLFNQGSPSPDPVSGSLTATAAHILFQPGVISFGSVRVDSTVNRTVVIRNNGTADLRVTSISINPPFVSDFSGPVTILPAHWTPVRISFTPDSALLYRDTLRVTSNAIEGMGLLSLSGTGTTLGVIDLPSAMPTQFALSQAFPNPFNPSTVMTFDVPRSARVTLTVYDILGQAIDTPLNGTMNPGHHSLQWSCPSCGSGIYLFVLSANGTRYVQKAMLIR